MRFDICADGIHASSEKGESVVEWPTPQTMHYVRSFLVSASYYRRCNWGYSQIARPLTDMTKAKVQWSGGSKEETSLNISKQHWILHH